MNSDLTGEVEHKAKLGIIDIVSPGPLIETSYRGDGEDREEG